MHGNHVKHMLIAGGGLVVVLVIAGVPLGTALPYAAALACPLMMVAMMLMMGRGRTGHGRGGHGETPAHHDEPVTAAPDPSPDVRRRGR